MSCDVVLHLYDLSQGMARNMSQQFLGKQIDGIWHTGVVVYGHEYFFGGGIAVSPPGMNQAGTPVQRIFLGTTQLAQTLFHDWLRSVQPQYTQNTYDLLKHNCNNFSDAVSNFLLGYGIPGFITGLPEEALNTPMGQMFKPMLENMQNQMQANPVGGGNGLLQLPSPYSTVTKYQGQVTSYHAPDTTTPTIASSSPSRRMVEQKTTQQQQQTTVQDSFTVKQLVLTKTDSAAHIHEQEQVQAVLSASTKAAEFKSFGTIVGSVKKFNTLITLWSKKLAKTDPALALSAADKTDLKQLIALVDGKTAEEPAAAQIELMDRLLAGFPTNKLAPVVGLFRLLALQPAVQTWYVEKLTAEQANSDSSDCSSCLDGICKPVHDQKVNKPMLQVAALSCLTNLFCGTPALATLLAHSGAVGRAAQTGLESKHASVRALAASLLYNVCTVYGRESELPEVLASPVELAVNLLETIQEETDGAALVAELAYAANLCYKRTEVCTVLHQLGGIPYEVVSNVSVDAQTRKAAQKLIQDIAYLVQSAAEKDEEEEEEEQQQQIPETPVSSEQDMKDQAVAAYMQLMAMAAANVQQQQQSPQSAPSVEVADKDSSQAEEDATAPATEETATEDSSA